MSEKDKRLPPTGEEALDEAGAVITYEADTAEGFFWVVRQDDDDDIIRRPKVSSR